MIQSEIDFARARRDDGVSRSYGHAEAARQGWQRRARGYLLEYLATKGGEFLAEDVREFAESKGLDAPPDPRAWGGVMQHALKDGIVVKAGYGAAKSSNLSPKVKWRGK